MSLTCSRCNKEVNVLVGDRCCDCNPFRACRKCGVGDYVSKPTPSWMNRFVCDKCGHKVSR